MPPSSLTLNYDALLTTTLFKYQPTLADQISTANAVFHVLKKSGAYKTTSSIGDRMQVPLMYALGSADSYSGYDSLNTTPMDGLTAAFWTWSQASVPIAISALERKKNKGEAQILNLFQSKVKQGELGIKEFFGKQFLQGAGGTSITTAYTSPVNGSVFMDPLLLLVKYDPTSATTVGNIPQAANAWWQNQTLNSTSSTFAAFRKEMIHLHNDCSKGPGGPPNLHLVDQSTYELYNAVLAALHQNPSYMKADIPFENVAFMGQALTWDEFMPDAQGGSVTQSTTSGTWVMLNTQFMEIQVDSETDFAPTPMVTPFDQDATTGHILWLGGVGVSNRRKHGVAGGIDTTITS